MANGMQTVRQFGVELEGQLQGRYDSNSELVYGTNITIDGQNWNVGSDCSVTGPRGGWGAEIRSPILSSTGPLIKMYEKMHAQGWSAHVSAGLHIHVDMRDLQPKHIKRLVALMTVVEPIMYAITDSSRYNNGYSSRMNYDSARIDRLKSKLRKRANTFDDINYGAGRAGLNINAYNEHGSVEFRYFASQDNVAIVEKYVEIVTKLVEFCKHAKLSQIKVIVSEMYEANFERSCDILTDMLGLTFNPTTLKQNDTFNRYQKVRWVETAEEKAERDRKRQEREAERAATAPAV